MVVDQVPLKLLDLLIGENHLRELPDAGVDPVHDLPGRDLLLQHGAAALDPLHGIGIDVYLFLVTGNLQDLFDGQTGSRDGKAHRDNSVQKLGRFKQALQEQTGRRAPPTRSPSRAQRFA